MSTNCIKCVKNKRTGHDLLCDECRNPSPVQIRAKNVLEALKRREANLIDWREWDQVSEVNSGIQIIQELLKRNEELDRERDYLLSTVIGERATWVYERETNSQSYNECRKAAEQGVLGDLKRLHELEPGETLDGS